MQAYQYYGGGASSKPKLRVSKPVLPAVGISGERMMINHGNIKQLGGSLSIQGSNSINGRSIDAGTGAQKIQ